MTEQTPEAPPQPMQPPTPAVTEKKSSLPVIVILLIAILLVGVGGVYAGMQIGKRRMAGGLIPQTTPTTIPQPTEIPTVIPATATNETADWKTYSDREYGLEIKYPSSWSESDATSFGNGILFKADNFKTFPQRSQSEAYGTSLTIMVPIKTAEDVKDWVRLHYSGKTVNDEPHIFSEEKVGSLVFQSVFGCGLGCYTNYHISNNGYVYGINFSTTEQPQTKNKEIQLKILSTFKFISPVSPSPTGSETKISYSPPAGWLVQANRTQVFQISYDSAKYDVEIPDDNSVQVVRKNLENWPYYSPYASSTYFTVYPYDNGSRHRFIEKQLGEPISENNKLTGKYKETEYIVSGKKCLVIDGISISQYPTTWGMCPISASQALLITTFDSEYLINFLKTLKFL